jgi:hypothetical protein
MISKAKMFRPETGEFEELQYRRDLLMLEKYRYVCAQIMITRAKLNKIIAAMIAGESYSSLEAEEKIAEFEKRLALVSSKLVLVSNSAKEVKQAFSIAQGLSISDSTMESYIKIKREMMEVEKSFGRLASIRAPELFSYITSETEGIAQRVQGMEKRLGSTADALLSTRLKRTKEYLHEYERSMAPEKKEGALK